MSIRSLISMASLCLVLVALPVNADSTTRDSQSSANSSAASATIIGGSAEVFAGSGQLSVGSVEIVGDSIVILLRGASESGEVSIKVSREIVSDVSIAVGTSIQIIAESTGYLLSAAGKMIAFVPNELGHSLFHHSRYWQGT